MRRVIRLSIIVVAAIHIAVPSVRAAERGAPIEMVYVKGGCFQMGSNDSENDEKPRHEVCVSDYAIGKYEVTRGAVAGGDGEQSIIF